jgi:hypothetical protein
MKQLNFEFWDEFTFQIQRSPYVRGLWPSWVPDWSYNPHLQPVTPLLLNNQAVKSYEVRGDTLAITYFPENHSTMTVKGFILDVVAVISSPVMSERSCARNEGVQKTYQEMWETLSKSPLSPYTGVEGRKEALLRAAKVCRWPADSAS